MSEAARLETFDTRWDEGNYKLTKEELAECGFIYTGYNDRTECAFCQGTFHDWEEWDDPTYLHLKAFPECPNSKENHKTHMGKYKDRICSFKDAPYCLTTKIIRNFARAGFYFTGVNDHIRCFECKTTLLDINYDEDIHSQHAFWSPQCPYLLEKKNAYFVETVLNTAEISNHRYKKHATEKIKISSISKEINHEIERHARKHFMTLKEEYEQNSDLRLCILCCDQDRDVIFSCKHCLCCSRCANMIKFCPVCKMTINSIERIYFG